MTLAIRKTRSDRRKTAAKPPVPTSLHITETEAPDLGVRRDSREAPEMHVWRSAEAPDAGNGRSACRSDDESHGRSRS